MAHILQSTCVVTAAFATVRLKLRKCRKMARPFEEGRISVSLNAVYRLGRSLLVPPSYEDCLAPSNLPLRNLRARFARPLILGASISANLKTLGPADRALRRLDLADVRPTRLAANGMTARTLMERLQPDQIFGSSVVLAIDMFFWDATLPSLKRSLKALDDLAALTKLHRTPAVLATIPNVTWRALQWARPELNRAIRRACAEHPHLRLLDLSAISRELEKTGGFWLGQEFYPWQDVAPDGIHLGAPACEYLAERLLTLF